MAESRPRSLAFLLPAGKAPTVHRDHVHQRAPVSSLCPTAWRWLRTDSSSSAPDPRSLPGAEGWDFLCQTIHLHAPSWVPNARSGGRSRLAVQTHRDWTAAGQRERQYFFYRKVSKLGGCPLGASVPINAMRGIFLGRRETRVRASLGSYIHT